MKRVLMIAYHFPPMAGSSGVQRTLRFVQHLPALGWEPYVLTAHPRAYESLSNDLMREIPAGLKVERAFALDTARHLSIFLRYPAFLARPDRWLLWKWGAVPRGLDLILRHRIDAIWSTYPIATAHLIGAELHRRTGAPWIADFRDPMAQDGYPADPKTRQSFRLIEEQAIENAARCVFVTPGAARVYRDRYPDAAASRLVVIENGYDEESFLAAESSAAPTARLQPGKITLLHSGIVYPSERDPTQLFAALGQLKQAGAIDGHTLQVRFRAAVHEPLLRQLAKQYGLEELVDIVPAIPYRDALVEMLRADALIVMQAQSCDEQIPAKLYEYLRAQRPILALTNPAGDTAQALRAAGVDAIAPLDSAAEIAKQLRELIHRIQSGSALLPNRDWVERCSRRHRSEELAQVLEAVTS